ncbi:hypothetical protein [Allomuricauda sp. M10]|uniref:hypothetical protein n=1 Tax=Allomuricauda sp. M10 TaxID=2683292 RepID=UPI001D195B59|nr:hypothetical protein [Muricauda sp. M10]
MSIIRQVKSQLLSFQNLVESTNCPTIDKKGSDTESQEHLDFTNDNRGLFI